MSDEILTVMEVAALLKVADNTVYTMAQEGGRSAEGCAVRLPGICSGTDVGGMNAGSRANVAWSFTVVKGSMIDETCAVFTARDFERSKRENLEERVRHRRHGGELRRIERVVTVSVASYFAEGTEAEEQAALDGIREECSRPIGAGKKVIVQ